MALKKANNKKAAANTKRGPKAKQVVEEKPEVEVEASEDDSNADEEENGINFDDGSDSEEAVGENNMIDSEAEEAEDDEDEEEDEDEDEDDDEDEDEDGVEPGEVSKVAKSADDEDDEDADSDEEPTEAPITKKEKPAAAPKKKTGIPKVPVGRIPSDTPNEQILFVTNLPIGYKHIEVIEMFTKFGPIAIVNRLKSKGGGNSLTIAFESPEAVDAALAAKEKAITLNGQVLNISRKHSFDELNKRTVAVKLIGNGVTKEQLTEHFKKCGAIESINFSHNREQPKAYVRFTSADAVPEALKLHGSQFNSRFITVHDMNYEKENLKTPQCTLTLVNTGNHESFKPDTIDKIFKKYGELADVDIVCTRSVLAFVTFKNAEHTQKALKELNGKTVNNLEIKLTSYNFCSSARTILVTNVAQAVEEQELREIFSEAGDVDSVRLIRPYKALVTFTSDEGFCKSFLMNERVVQGQPIFLEPNSKLKHKMLKGSAQKRPFSSGAQSGPPAKYQKFNRNDNNNRKPFNKRPHQGNGLPQKSFKKAKDGNPFVKPQL